MLRLQNLIQGDNMRNVTKTLMITIIGAVLIILVGCPQPTNGDGSGDGGSAVGTFKLVDFDVNGDGVVDDGEAVDGEGAERYEITTLVDDSDAPITDGEGRYTRIVKGTFADDLWLTNDTVWILQGAVRIGNNASSPAAASGNTVYVEAGTEIRGTVSAVDPGALFITRGSDIYADGLREFDTSGAYAVQTTDLASPDPIIFTSNNAVGTRAPGDWGGLVINGYARVQGGTATGEGDSGEYGGGDPGYDDTDNSGTLRYVVVQFAGTLFGADDELNGIAFQGVGSGTTVEYIQVHQNADDGVEFFGGSVQAKYLVLTGNNDDSLDGDDGWNGSAQFVMIQQYEGNNSILELDGDSDTGTIDASNAIIANVTGVGATTDREDGVRLKSAAEQRIFNSLFVNLSGSVAAVNTDGAGPAHDFQGVIVEGATITNPGEFDATANGSASAAGNQWSSTPGDLVTWPNTDHIDGPAFNAQPTSISGGAPATVPGTDAAGNTLVDTDYIGAVDPDGSDWTVGWTFFPAD
jgi:hypothetical protein